MTWMKQAIYVVFLVLVVASGTQAQAPADCTVASADLVAAWTDAQTTHCLDVPAGTYTVTGQGVLLAATADNLDIHGAGIGQTVITVTDGLTLTQDLIVIRLYGTNQRIRDLTIDMGAGHTGPWGTFGVSVYDTADRSMLTQLEVRGGYSTDGARGAGIATYRPWNIQNAAQWVTIADSWVHDTQSSGMVINSSNNTVRHNRIERTGNSTLAHGIYAQGGYNLYDGNYISGVRGYSYHAYKQVPRIDGSGDRFVNNTSINPGSGHVIIQGLPHDATNLDIPAGQRLTRYTTIANNVFRNSADHPSNGVSATEMTLIESNVFENVGMNGSQQIRVGAAGSVVRDNRIYSTQRGFGIQVDAASTVGGNTIEGNIPVGITVNGAGARVADNRIVLSSVTGVNPIGIAVSAANVVISNNDITIVGPGAALKAYTTATGLLARGNVLVATNGAWYQDVPASLVGAAMDNVQR